MSLKYLTPIDLNKNEIRNAVLQNLSSAPSSPVEGQIYENTTTHNPQYHNGSTWVDFAALSTSNPIALGSVNAGSGGSASKYDHVHPTTGLVLTGSSSTLSDGVNLVFGTSTGTQLGTGSTQKIGFLGATPVAQISGSIDVLASLVTLGLRAASSNPALNLGSGVITAGSSTISGLSLNSQKITSLADGTATTDAASWGQVQNLLNGLDWHQSVRVATITTLPAYGRVTNVITETGNGALPAIDGKTLVVNDRLLLKNGAAGADNGIYIVTTVGDGSTQFVLTRATDADTSAEVTSSQTVFVEEGTTLGGTAWTLTTANPITLNSTTLTYTQTGGPGSYTADESTLHLTGTAFSIKSTYVGQTSITTLGTITTGTWTGTSIAVANGGTGAATAATARTNLVVPSRYTALVGDGVNTVYTINHALSQQYCLVQVFDASTFAEVIVDVALTDANNATLTFAAIPASNTYRVVVIG